MRLQGNMGRVRISLILYVRVLRIVLNNEKQKCKIRGFTLNYKNSQVLNFETMKDMVLNLDNRITVKIVNDSRLIQ